ncbi:hypothetical protein AAHA92_28633 [Salvia divinorum]|uniref:DC1 domain-containing protein n=1 Tax=Salvia divinorum TaxID=28513 RepID=A0ABD1FWP9_SALDI
METKHFSHQHPLAFHQVHHASQTHCSGCKSPATGNVYACWQCSYFLHEQCFHAARSLRHPSHPLHPLSLVPLPTYPSASFFCNSCNLPGDGFSYCCSACDFDIHVHCALIPNPNPPHLAPPHDHHPQNPSVYPPPNPHPQNPSVYPPPNTIQPTTYPTMAYPPPPQNYVPPAADLPLPPQPHPTYSTVVNATTANPPPTGYPQPHPPAPAAVVNPTTNPPQPLPKPPAASIIKHFSHPHVLKQMEIEEKKAKICSACECELSGSAYCCTESYCTFNLHKDCFDSPREVRHKSHLEHPLTLLAAPPYSDGFTCNACLKDGKAFAYNCAACSFDLHIDCVRWPDAVARPDHKHDLTLYYSSPAAAGSGQEAATFECDVCRNPVHEMAWLYLCRECDFGTHLECVASGIIQQQDGGGAAKAEDELLREVELKFAVLQLLLGAQAQRGAPSVI